MSSKAHYAGILTARLTLLESAFDVDSFDTRHTAAHSRLTDFEALLFEVRYRREAHLQNLAAELLAESLFQIATLNYRMAFFSLRAFLEIGLVAIRFSAFELDLRLWEVGKRDTTWAELMSEDKGVFCRPFVSSFLPGLEEVSAQYSALAKRVYRRSSEFVHGNRHTHNLPAVYDEDLVSKYFEDLEAAYLSVAFGFIARYIQEVVDADNSVIDRIGDIVRADFSHLASVQAVLNA